jgi:hypothetical protein
LLTILTHRKPKKKTEAKPTGANKEAIRKSTTASILDMEYGGADTVASSSRPRSSGAASRPMHSQDTPASQALAMDSRQHQLQSLATRLNSISERVDAQRDDISQYTPLIVSKSLLSASALDVSAEVNTGVDGYNRTSIDLRRSKDLDIKPAYPSSSVGPNASFVSDFDEHLSSSLPFNRSSHQQSLGLGSSRDAPMLAATGASSAVRTSISSGVGDSVEISDIDQRILKLQDYLNNAR